MKTVTLLFLIATVTLAHGQTSLVLQPDAAAGKDALIFNLDALANYGNNPDFIASQWSFSGEPGTMRSLIQFDLSSLPKGVDIVDARLSLTIIMKQQHRGRTETMQHTSAGLLNPGRKTQLPGI